MSHSADVVILTALPVEFAAVTAALGHGQQHVWSGSDVYSGELDGQRVVVAPLGGMGTNRASLTTERAVRAWNPSRLLLVGIAGGVAAGADDLRLGDVLVPDQVVGYELAKVRPTGAEPRWEVFRPDSELLAAARQVTPQEWVHSVTVPRPDGSDGRVVPRAHFGPVLSGDKVLADAATVEGLRKSWPKAVGVEMEAVGVALAAYTGGPAFLMVRSVSDLADNLKDDSWHRYAAAAAAAFALAALRHAPPAPDSDRPQALPIAAPRQYPGAVKLHIVRNLGDSWEDVADLFDIADYERARFRRGSEPRDLWSWLEARGKLPSLPDVLGEVGRTELARHMLQNGLPRACLQRSQPLQ